MNLGKNWRSPARRFIGHPYAAINADYYAMEMVEGRKTRGDVKNEGYAHMYSGGLKPFKAYGVESTS